MNNQKEWKRIALVALFVLLLMGMGNSFMEYDIFTTPQSMLATGGVGGVIFAFIMYYFFKNDNDANSSTST